MAAQSLFPEEFESRDQETTEEIRRVLDSPGERASSVPWWRELAAAYEARARFWADVVDYATGLGLGVVFSALLDARGKNRMRADRAWQQARELAVCEQERAFASYAANLAAVA